jgi:hypothetical protein
MIARPQSDTAGEFISVVDVAKRERRPAVQLANMDASGPARGLSTHGASEHLCPREARGRRSGRIAEGPTVRWGPFRVTNQPGARLVTPPMGILYSFSPANQEAVCGRCVCSWGSTAPLTGQSFLAIPSGEPPFWHQCNCRDATPGRLYSPRRAPRVADNPNCYCAQDLLVANATHS